jgi:sarcosine oxidase subunit alpha
VLPHAKETLELKAPEGAGDPPSNRIEYYRVPCRPGDEKYQFVDLQNDVTVADLRQALSEGFTDIEHVKRYTTLGVGTDQGATCAALGASILAELASTRGSAIRTSRQRPPYQPLTLATLSGFRRDHALRPERRTAIHAWHVANGTVMEDVALWMRPRYYRANGSDPFAAGTKEALHVRTSGGVFDASTLGKIEIAGKDASEYLDRIYLNRMSTLAIGRAKYGVLLREDGMVLDDGIVFRATEDRYTATTSSGHAAPVLAHFEFWRDCEFSRRDVAIADVTEAWSTIVVAGPSCRRHLREALGEAWSAGIEKLGHMHVTTGIWNAAALRVLRASFSGELAFELHCQPTVALELWQRLVATGLSPYGMEAADILRLEKGYLVSSEINGQTSPHDLRMNALLTSNNPCIGRELLNRPGLH